MQKEVVRGPLLFLFLKEILFRNFLFLKKCRQGTLLPDRRSSARLATPAGA
jgi:hypothetical protein